jgi:hypothetical protein
MPAGVSAYTALANVTLGSSASQVVFSSIASYRDYVLVFNARATSTDFLYYRLNGDTGNNFSIVTMYGPTGSGSATESRFFCGDLGTTDFTSGVSNIMDASATDKHKSQLTRWGVGGSQVWALAGRWANTNAVTSITFLTNASQIAAGSTFALYGVSA